MERTFNGAKTTAGDRQMAPKTLGCAAAALLAAVALSTPALNAQAPSAEPAHKTRVLAGCVEQDAQNKATFMLTGATDQSASAADAPASAQATPRDSRPGAREDAVGTSGAAAGATAATPNKFELHVQTGIGANTSTPIELEKFVGQRVEITARPVDVIPTPEPKTSGTATLDRPVASPESPERITVTAIKMLSASCR